MSRANCNLSEPTISNGLTPVRKRIDPLQPGPGEGNRYNLVPFSKLRLEKGKSAVFSTSKLPNN